MSEHSVVIVGGGPTGLMLAGELALAGVDVAIVERRANQDLVGSRAGGLHARTLELFDQRGIVDRFLAEGQIAQVTGFAMARLDISDFPTRHNYGLALWQAHIERILANRVNELPVQWYRSLDVADFTQNAASVDVKLSDGQSLRAQYLIGCDGGRSFVRKRAGIGFPGWDATSSNILGEVEMTEKPPMGIHRTALGTHSFGREQYEIVNDEVVFKDIGPIRLMVPEAIAGNTDVPTLGELRDALIAVCGTDFGVHSPKWISRFSDTSRQADAYRKGRVLLAGDAAHVHSPIGGQGLNTGVQDAMNLGWKLAQVVKGVSPERLLDSYHAERHPVGARVLQMTMAQVAMHRPDERTQAVRDVVGELVQMEEPRKHLAATLSGLGIRYDFGDGHPLRGRRMPDLDIDTANGVVRVYSLLHTGRPLLLNFTALDVDVAPWLDRVQWVDAKYDGAWELPAIGVVSAPTAVLIRPDGYVCWVGEGTQLGLIDSLTAWFGDA